MQRSSSCLATLARGFASRRRVYVIAGEPSGDAIGAKVLRALERQVQERGASSAMELEVRGVGGPLMCAAGGFASLFPMRELSIMGLTELLPHLWRLRRRLHDTLHDIHAFEPHVVLTIDSKGFSFRVLEALRADPRARDRVARMHYVAPSVWAYTHRRGRDWSKLSGLLHRMFVLLPFERELFERAGDDGQDARWCQFVGHPAVEDFLEFHGQFDAATSGAGGPTSRHEMAELKRKLRSAPDALLDFDQLDADELMRQTAVFQALMTSASPSATASRRKELGIPTDAFVICALVGSRENEVARTMQVVMDGIERFRAAQADVAAPSRPIFVVFPTISAVEARVKRELRAHSVASTLVLTDLSASERFRLFQIADAAVAVSGTIVMETTLAALPTVVVYRANRLTELLASRLAAVRFVSIPNLLLGRAVIPELLFRECTAGNIDAALRRIGAESSSLTQDPVPRDSEAALALPAALSTLVSWRSGRPVRASDVVASAILDALERAPPSS